LIAANDYLIDLIACLIVLITSSVTLRWPSYAMSLFSLIKPHSLFSFSNRSLPCLKEAENLQQLHVFLQQKTVGGKMHILWSSRSTTYSYRRCVLCIYSVPECVNNAVDCAIIPYHLKCIMRSPEVPLISLCLKVSVNFSQL